LKLPRCKKILANGERCKVAALKGQKYCLFHSNKPPKYNGGKRRLDDKTLADESVNLTDDTKVKLSDIVTSSLDNRFVQNQLIRQGTSAAGIAAIATGSSMIKSGSAPRTEFRSHLPLRDTTGKKTFKPYTWRGRRYTKPLAKDDFGGNNARYGYNTNTRGRHIKKSPGKVRTGKVLRGFGRASGAIGIGLVGYNIHRHGVKKTAKDEAKFNWSFSPIGMIDEGLLGNRIEQSFLGQTGTGRTIQAMASMALLEALL